MTARSADPQGAHHQPQRALFARFARWTERQVGKSTTFVLAIACVVVWAITGPVFGYSDTWQLVINTGTTIITFLMVFVIQNTQSRDTQAIHLKLDELIRVNRAARNSLISLEEMSESDIAEIKETFARLKTRTTLEREPAGADAAPGSGAMPKS